MLCRGIPHVLCVFWGTHVLLLAKFQELDKSEEFEKASTSLAEAFGEGTCGLGRPRASKKWRYWPIHVGGKIGRSRCHDSDQK